MKTITKGLVGTVAAGAMALSTASPALARDSHNGHHDGISAGDVIAGALIIGGIAAVASAASHHDNNRYDGYDGRYNNGNYDRRGYDGRYGSSYRGNSNTAVRMCINVATQEANRRSYGGRANVTDIRNVDRNRDGFTVRGRLTVNSYRGGDGYRGDYRGRGWDNNYRGYDSGSFKCKVRHGRVVNLDFNGIRGL